MTKQEAINIKDEILKKEGSIHICNIITIDGVVLIKDMLEIVDKHVAESEDDEKKPYNTDIENPTIKHWIFERAECNFINHDLWDFKLRCPNCFTVSTFSRSPFAIHTFSDPEDSKCPVCGEPLILDPEDMFKNEKTDAIIEADKAERIGEK